MNQNQVREGLLTENFQKIEPIINLNKKDINGKNWELALAEIPKEEHYKYWSWDFYEWRDGKFYCYRCGETEDAYFYYNGAKNKRELRGYQEKEGEFKGYYGGYCALCAWAKGYSHAYQPVRDGIAYDYYQRYGDDYYDDHYKWRSKTCCSCETGRNWQEYLQNEAEEIDVYNYSYLVEVFNDWYRQKGY
jgi:hypothetical protein